MNGGSEASPELHVDEVFPNSLLEYAKDLVFPWDLDKPLNGAAVGQGLFQQAKPNASWDTPEIRAALMKLAQKGRDKLHANLDEFPEWVRDVSVDDGDLSAPDRNLGMILVLDPGARYLCKGVNARYAYEVFQQIPIHTIKYITNAGMASLKDWEFAGIDKDQAMIRVIIMLGALVHSESPDDHDDHLRLTEKLRAEYERMTRTHDPFRQSLSQDIEDIELFGQMLEEGPPQWKGVHMSDVVYWMMRFYTSHIAFLRHFKRSPFRNVALGRDDTEEEIQWLNNLGVQRTEEDQEARELIRQDIESGRWRPLQL